jgi:hypothetical protein
VVPAEKGMSTMAMVGNRESDADDSVKRS